MFGRLVFRGCLVGFFALTIVGERALSASEPLELVPREAEILTVMPRVTTAAPTPDPAWLYRGSIRPDGTFEAPLPEGKHEINRRQIELLRTLDKLRAVNPGDDLDPSRGKLPSIADKLGKPEVLPISPRIVK